MLKRVRPQWDQISTVLLDMDGTLLDLRFDNHFWLDLVPQAFASARGVDINAARLEIEPKFAAMQGMLQWYCTDYWSTTLGLDIVGLKESAREHIRFLPGAEGFLERLLASGRRVILVTNAHHDALNVKSRHTGIHALVHEMRSSHSLGVAKEHPDFWPRFACHHAFEPTQTLFVDDSLPVLRNARAHGIAQVFAISRPDSTLPARTIDEFPSVEAIAELWEA
jgi:putative hydrolase of the HAD superfamily